jgi:uncharacterized membrane protein YdjX (TVP38/TMEM64 family)
MTVTIEHFVRSSGIGAPLAFVALYLLLTVVMVPGSVPSVVAGALFGALWGTVLTLVGATLGATAAFLIARRFGRPLVQRRAGRRFEQLDDWIARRGFLTILCVRLVPVFPFNVVNYAAGATRVPARTYIVATALGIAPASFAFVAFGSSLRDPGSPGFFVTLGLVVALMIGAPLAGRVSRRRAPAPTPPSGP